MKIAVVGTGYVGLVTGTCFADTGNDVTCIDIDQKKIDNLNKGIIPIYEPGLTEMVLHNYEAQRLHFTTDLPAAIKPAEVVYLAVGTPQGEDGAANLSAMWAVVEAISPHLRDDAVVVTKSTVPVGTNERIYSMLKDFTGRNCHVASNPEFLKEGAAIEDFMKPDRVVVGVRDEEDAEVLRQLYKPFLRTEKPFLVMSPQSAEMTKYVANALLSTKISFINEMANLCEKMGGDINDVRRGIGHDSRIGFAFLFPGVGYGGSCFPKDVRALAAMAEEHGTVPQMLRSVDEVNERQKTVMIDKVKTHFDGKLEGKTITVWGLAFKPRTDDIREAPALVLIDWMLEQGATVRVQDPEALEKVKADYGDKLTYCERRMGSVDGADALVIMTEWKDYHSPDFAEMYQLMASPVIFDGRNLYEPERMKRRGYTYHSIGRPTVSPSD
ncbi:UDP-glucose dehydrogenase family protein [Adhaeretor mobilis]|uniref:UDP-glucose 6-dehydrogenase n=1 Tax=Adhaeretor mobilis TaxID=1930276 RepID=A0A517MPM5_9BACT|nr:UDP-glucose/GDP-mannose dehydrogenase family protein [Adhaeretor mobilis]QDS96831.1 UDP-glucose 6-dehydrogenase [Adhaeretor mobilis]